MAGRSDESVQRDPSEPAAGGVENGAGTRAGHSVLVRHTISDMLETCRELNFDLLPCELILPIQNATEQTAALIAL
jgi:hypothetical protein